MAASRQSAYRGCLLGLAVGDAMGYTVDNRSWQEIREDYGPNGLLGYDLVNGYADVTSYTQLAAFTCNGLLFGMTRGQLSGKMAPYIKYIEMSSREWAASQRSWGRPKSCYCWLLRRPDLCRRHCMDTRMLDTLSREAPNSLESPVNNFSDPAGLTAAIGVGLFYHKDRMDWREMARLGAEAVALTHGSPEAFLTGAWVAYTVAGIAQEGALALRDQFVQAAEAVAAQFSRQFPQAMKLKEAVGRGVRMAKNGLMEPEEAMEALHCQDALGVAAGAVYACLKGEGDFDRSMILAVNHSGRSAAVGALTGAFLGAKLGEEALPEFYLECLEPAPELRILAEDLARGCPMDLRSRLFDDDWDHKYVQGEPVDTTVWME